MEYRYINSITQHSENTTLCTLEEPSYLVECSLPQQPLIIGQLGSSFTAEIWVTDWQQLIQHTLHQQHTHSHCSLITTVV